jgi:hypothetical protein
MRAHPEGEFPFRSLYNALNQKQNKSITSILFEPSELENFNKLVKLGDKFGNAVMSTSGTGASNALRESVKQIGNNIADDAIGREMKTKARAIGFDVNEPLRNAANGPLKPPTMGFAPQGLGPMEKLGLSDWRKRLIRSYSSQNNEEEK